MRGARDIAETLYNSDTRQIFSMVAAATQLTSKDRKRNGGLDRAINTAAGHRYIFRISQCCGVCVTWNLVGFVMINSENCWNIW